MNKVLLLLLIVFPIYICFSLYYLDKDYFLCPIRYQHNLIVRVDSRGNGFFASSRNGNRLHKGIDLFAEVGSPVYAVRLGRVIEVNQDKGAGNYIKLAHSSHLVTLYGHLCRVYVYAGEIVRQGQIIGRVGKTGNANHRDIQPHLHFEVRKDGLAQDPLGYLQ